MWPSDGCNGRLTTRDLLKFRFDGERSAVNVHRVHHHRIFDVGFYFRSSCNRVVRPVFHCPLKFTTAERHVRNTYAHPERAYLVNAATTFKGNRTNCTTDRGTSRRNDYECVNMFPLPSKPVYFLVRAKLTTRRYRRTVESGRVYLGSEK